MMRSFLSLLLAVIPTAITAELDMIDATEQFMQSPDPTMQHAIGFMNPAEVSFFWNDVKDGVLHGKMVSIVPDAEAPSWLGLGIFEGCFTKSANVFEKSDWVIGNQVDGTVKKFHSRGASDLASATEAADQSLTGTMFFQFKLGDGRTATLVEFQKKLSDGADDIQIHEFCQMTFLWAEGKPGAGGGISSAGDMGAFTLILGAAAGRSGDCALDGAGGGGGGGDGNLRGSDGGTGATSTDATIKGQWISAHNTRRTAEFAEHGVSDVPLQWSEDLAQSAQAYADKLILLDGCVIMHYYQDDHYGGENLAMAWGTSGWVKNDPERALDGWYNSEKPLPYGQNGHYTQVAWRATKYVGCGMAFKAVDAENDCAIEVCRYMKPANCNINAGNWLERMIADDSPCGPDCPAEGCF